MLGFDVPVEVTRLAECLVAMRTAEGFLPGVGTEVAFEIGGLGETFLTVVTSSM